MRVVRIFTQQTTNTPGYVVKTTCGIEAWRDTKTDVRRTQGFMIMPRHLDQRQHTGSTTSCTYSPEALFDQGAIDPIQRYQIGNCADGNEIQQICQRSAARRIIIFCQGTT